jgi:hypothetical protein
VPDWGLYRALFKCYLGREGIIFIGVGTGDLEGIIVISEGTGGVAPGGCRNKGA